MWGCDGLEKRVLDTFLASKSFGLVCEKHIPRRVYIVLTNAADRLLGAHVSSEKISLPFDGSPRWSQSMYFISRFSRFNDEEHEISAEKITTGVQTEAAVLVLS